MKRKTIFSICIRSIIGVALLVGVICLGIQIYQKVAMPFPSPEDSSNGTEGSIYWIEEDCCFIDYTIIGSRVYFQYQITLENATSQDFVIHGITGFFSENQLEGWLLPASGYYGIPVEGSKQITLDNETKGMILSSGKKVQFIFVFDGDYLGGKVSEQLDLISVHCYQTEITPITHRPLHETVCVIIPKKDS